jgi:hypothetical protein
MSEHFKKYNDFSDFITASQDLSRFQKIHNAIRKDYIELLRITDNHKSIETEFDALYRACLKSLFSLIEADIYSLNILDTYNDYDDRKGAFIDKLKETYKQISKTWNKAEIQKRYFETKLVELKELRKIRDELIHPKTIEHVHKASELDYEKVKRVFNDYDNFVNELMNDFFISTEIKI